MKRLASIALPLLFISASVGHASASSGMVTISPDDVRLRQLHSQTMILIDCRAHSDYEVEHITGATSIPLFQLGFLPLPKDRDLILYCSGTGCNISLAGARKLQGLGYTRVLVMAEGIAGWEARGYPVVKAKTADKPTNDDKH